MSMMHDVSTGDNGDCHDSEHLCTSTEHSRHQLSWSKTSKLKTTAKHNLLLSCRYHYSKCTEKSFLKSRLLRIKLKKDKKPNAKEINCSCIFCCNYENEEFFSYTEEYISHLTCCTMAHAIIITGLSPVV